MKTYYLYLDDSGSRLPDRQPTCPRNDGMDYFAIGGILVEESKRKELVAAHTDFCSRWNINYPLHSTKIRGKRDRFLWLGKNAEYFEKFMCDLELLLCNLPVVGFATVIDRNGYNKRYREQYGDQRWNMCKTAFTIVVERAAKYVDLEGGKLKIRFEENGLFEDRAIQDYLKDLKRNGHPFDANRANSYQGLMSEDYKRIIVGDAERRKKASPELQFADLYLYPMVKGGYDNTYSPFQSLMKAKRLINAFLPEEKISTLGIKYSCFENVKKQKA